MSQRGKKKVEQQTKSDSHLKHIQMKSHVELEYENSIESPQPPKFEYKAIKKGHVLRDQQGHCFFTQSL